MIKGKNFLITAVILLVWSSLSAQEDKWTLQECIDYALKNNINIQRNDLTIVQNRVSVDQSKADLFPSVNAQASHVYNYGQNVNPVTNLITDLDSRTNTFGLSASVTLFDGLANYNSIRQNNLLLGAAISDLEQAKNDVGLNVAQAYLQIIFNQELLEAAELQVESSKEQLRRTEILYRNGALPQQDYLQTQAQNASNEAQVVVRKNDLRLSRLQLMQLLLLPYDPNFSIVVPDIEPENTDPITLGSEEIFALALQTQPIVKASEERIKASEAGINVAKGSHYPSLQAFAGVDTRYNNQTTAFSFSEQLDNNLGQNIGFNLNIPIFNNFLVKQSVQNARINNERAKLDQTEIKINLRQEVEQAYLNAIAALETYKSSLQQVEALELAFKNIERQRDAGAVNVTDYVIIQNDYNSALSDMIRAKYDYLFRLEVLDFYQGKPIEL